MWHLSSFQRRAYPEQAALKALQQVAPAFGLTARDVKAGLARDARAVGLIGEDYILHLVPSAPAWEIDQPADLVQEGKVLDYLATALPAGAIAVPKVVQTQALPEGIAQLRTSINGDSYEALAERNQLNYADFAASLAEAIADIHDVPIEPLRDLLGQKNPRCAPDISAVIAKARQQMDDYLWVGGHDILLRFNEISRHNTDKDVLLHNDLLPRNFRLCRSNSELTGVYDFGHAYLGHYLSEFREIGNVYPRPDVLCDVYAERTGRRISPTVFAADSVAQYFFECCQIGQHVPGHMQDALADKLDHYEQVVKRYGPLERAFT